MKEVSILPLAKEEILAGWGNYPKQKGYLFRPENRNDIIEIVQDKLTNDIIAYGLGRSYGDTPLNLNSGVLLTTKLNRFISFDEKNGVLECEAGVSLEEIIKFFLPKGFFLPVTPGTKYVTVGGAIANDVHGKNHHVDGSFSNFVIDFKLLLASGEIVNCSREENSDIFWATIGGIGLTGLIISARIKLNKVETAYYDVTYEKAKNIDHALELFMQSDDKYQYSVAWIDCLATGKSLGRSVLMRANHAKIKQLDSKKMTSPLKIVEKRKLNVPFNLPSVMLNSMTMKLFNKLYYGIHKNISKIVDYDSFFYPLDAIMNWNRMYGKRGFVQYQAVFPSALGRDGLVKMLERLSSTGRSSFLAVLKSSGEEGQGLLSFPKKGYTLALDIPIKNNSLFPFLKELDEIVINYGGRVYLAKDSVLSPDHFKIMYPRWREFVEVKRRIDPYNYFSSSMAKRLKIVEGSYNG